MAGEVREMKITVKRESRLAETLQDLLTSLGPLRVFKGFPDRTDQDVFVANIRRAEEVLAKLRAGTLGK